MIIFAMAWVMIGEYAVDFKDYVIAAAVVLATVVVLALQSIRLYTLEDLLPDAEGPVFERQQKRRTGLYAVIFVLEGIAVMITWMIVLRSGSSQWLVPGFALVAGLHFFPLARLIRLNSYYILGAWICLLAVAGYLLVHTGTVPAGAGNALVAYGCAAGALVDGVWIVLKTMQRV
jgi:hypothetical protein